MKYKVKVTIEQEVDLEMMPMSLGMTKDEFLEDFSSHIYHVDGMEDIAKYAAEMYVFHDRGKFFDGLGIIDMSKGDNVGVVIHNSSKQYNTELLRED